MEEDRKKRAQSQQSNISQITIQKPGKDPIVLTNDQIVNIIHEQQKEIKKLTIELQKRNDEIAKLTEISNKTPEQFQITEPVKINDNK